MKRGLITWDKAEISPAVFERRLEIVRTALRERRLPALVVYSDLWRSNQARFFANYMPYFNRALLIIPVDHPPTLLCGLSPRVYGWIRSVTIIEDVRPAPNFAKSLFQLAAERSWTKFGILDFEQFPYDMYTALRGGSVELLNVDSDAVYCPGKDETERAMRTKAAEMAREILEKELSKGVGIIDHHFTGRLERQFRRLGAEDLIILLSNGQTVPAPPTGAQLEENYSVSVALEYRGHWVRVTRPQGSPELLRDCRAAFESKKQQLPSLAKEGWLRHQQEVPVPKQAQTGWFVQENSLDQHHPGASRHPSSTEEGSSVFVEDLSGSYPYEYGPGSILSLQVELNHNGKRLFYGDTIL